MIQLARQHGMFFVQVSVSQPLSSCHVGRMPLLEMGPDGICRSGISSLRTGGQSVSTCVTPASPARQSWTWYV